jgi:hypothetical protein
MNFSSAAQQSHQTPHAYLGSKASSIVLWGLAPNPLGPLRGFWESRRGLVVFFRKRANKCWFRVVQDSILYQFGLTSSILSEKEN